MFFGKAKTHLLKNAEILHSATSGEIPTKLTNTTETFKITQCKGVKLEGKRTFGLTDLLFLHASQIKERVFHLPRLISYIAVGTDAQEFISVTDCPEL